MTVTSRRFPPAALVLLGALFAVAHVAPADTVMWIAESGDRDDDANWPTGNGARSIDDAIVATSPAGAAITTDITVGARSRSWLEAARHCMGWGRLHFVV